MNATRGALRESPPRPGSPGRSRRVSPKLRPVQVMGDPSSSPFSNKYLSTAGVPPTREISSITYSPDGFKLARNGVESDTA